MLELLNHCALIWEWKLEDLPQPEINMFVLSIFPDSNA